MKLLALCDSPTLQTGFGRVAQNLLSRWLPVCERLDVWGIGYFGVPHTLPYRIWPAGREWNSGKCLSEFLTLLQLGGYTHVWVMQDTFMLAEPSFLKYFRAVCRKAGIVSVGYFPVDAPLCKEWLGFVETVTHAVAYTTYGEDELQKHTERELVNLPHGVDTSTYRPLGRKAELRQDLFGKGWIEEGDFLMVNVASHQRRKDVLRSLEIMALLREEGVPAKLFLVMDNKSADGVELEAVTAQLELKRGEYWDHSGEYFKRGHTSITEAKLNQIYNSADLFLTTTLGEGWGLPAMEALAAGCPACFPAHTACFEIWAKLRAMGMGRRMISLSLEPGGIVLPGDNSRVRYRVDLRLAAHEIAIARHGLEYGQPLTDEAERWLDWDRVADEFMKLMRGQPPAVSASLSVIADDSVWERVARPQFKAFILTCPSRSTVLEQTVTYLKQTDWGADPVIQMDESQAERLQERQTVNSRGLLVKALAMKDWEYMLFLEDDVMFNVHLRHNLENWWPVLSATLHFGSLYNPTIAERSRFPQRNYFMADPGAVYGSQAFILSRPCAQYILDNFYSVEGMQDIKFSRLAAQFDENRIYYHTPSLVQHCAVPSTWGGGCHITRDFNPTFKSNGVIKS